MDKLTVILLFIALQGGPSAQDSFWNKIPVISQLKSLGQAIGGDLKGAKATQEIFSRGPFLPVSLSRAAIEAAKGDSDNAKKTLNQIRVSYKVKNPFLSKVLKTDLFTRQIKQKQIHLPSAAAKTAKGDSNNAKKTLDQIRVSYKIKNPFLRKYIKTDLFTRQIKQKQKQIHLPSAAAKTAKVESDNAKKIWDQIRVSYKLRNPSLTDYIAEQVKKNSQTRPSALGPLSSAVAARVESENTKKIWDQIRVSYKIKYPSVTDFLAEQMKKESSQKRQSDDRCWSSPIITNSDKLKMSSCSGSKLKDRCRLQCLENYEPTRKSVKCDKNLIGVAEWQLGGAQCISKIDVVCRDSFNRKVDWFALYKMPKKLEKGVLPTDLTDSYYLFISDEPTDEWDFGTDFEFLKYGQSRWADWTTNRGFGGINGPTSLDNTLSLLKDADVTYAMYSDQPPVTTGNTQKFAHAKGVIAKRNEKGFILFHSLPRFPSQPGSTGSGKWSQRNGQLSICVSFNAKISWNTVATHVKNLNAFVYSERFWNRDSGGLAFNSGVSTSHFLSEKNNRFDLFTKSTVDDIYDIISKHYEVSLNVHTWPNGGGGKILGSICDGDREVLNVEALGFSQNGDITAGWKSTQDHSKWAVSPEYAKTGVFCASDLNRRDSQTKRSGGAVCFKNDRIVQAFRALIKHTSKCPRRDLK